MKFSVCKEADNWFERNIVIYTTNLQAQYVIVNGGISEKFAQWQHAIDGGEK